MVSLAHNLAETKKDPRQRMPGVFRVCDQPILQLGDVRGLQPLRTLADLELHLVIFLQRLEAVGGDRAGVCRDSNGDQGRSHHSGIAAL